MGEPLAQVLQNGIQSFLIKKIIIVNTYFQTETGGIISSPTYKEFVYDAPHGSVGKPVTKFIKFNRLFKNKPKEIIIKNPWPGLMKNVINGKKFFKNYFDKNGNFRLFDLATINNNNYYIHGRVDDVINIRGHRIGSAELEATVLTNQKVKECSAVSVEDELEGNTFILFLVANNKKVNEEDIKKIIFSSFGSFALPKKIFFIENLPKTRSGKILRRVLRELYMNPNDTKFNDLSTITDKALINQLKKRFQMIDRDLYKIMSESLNLKIHKINEKTDMQNTKMG